MADREMVLRYLAFRETRITEYAYQDFNVFLRNAMKAINEWDPERRLQMVEEFSAVMKLAARIFGNDAFRKRYRAKDPRRPVSKALFESVAVALAVIRAERSGNTARLVKNKLAIRRGFRELMNTPEFDRAVSQGTGDPVRVRVRFESLVDLMRKNSV